MAPVPVTVQPRDCMSERCTPSQLIEMLRAFFAQRNDDRVWLVGGTALAGYYAEHRRSDDLKLFAADARAFDDAVRIVRSLGATLTNESRTPNYYHADAEYCDHRFTIDIVLDEVLHRFGSGVHSADGVWIPDFLTLFAMKASTLISRCSEKDLYDLAWCFDQLGGIDVAQIITLGREVDAGLSTETLLISLCGASISQDACGFVLDDGPSTAEAFQEIACLKAQLIEAVRDFERNQGCEGDAADLAKSLRAIEQFKEK